MPTELDELIRKGLVRYGNDPALEIEIVPIGIPKLDEVLGGGLPRGRNVLFVGDYSGGKTFLSQQAIRAIQQQGGTAAYIDVERSFDREWFEASGVDVSKLLVSVPEYGERAIDVCVGLLEASVDIVVLDSIAALVPLAEVEEESVEKQFIGNHPRLVSRAYGLITIANKNSIFLAINQSRQEIGPYGAETYPGGRKQKQMSHIICRVRREGWIKEKDKKVGFDINIEAIKNKVAQPWKSCSIPFRFDGGLDETVSNIDLGLAQGVIQRAGPYYKWMDHDLKWLGKADMRAYMEEHPDDYALLLKEIS